MYCIQQNWGNNPTLVLDCRERKHFNWDRTDSLPQVEVLQEEVTYANEEVERLAKVLDEQSTLLQALQEKTAQKDIVIQNLKKKVKLLS